MTKQRKQNGRLESLDALRGFDMFFIMGGGPLILAICAALGGGDIGVTGTDDFIHLRYTLGTVGERGDCLSPADTENPVYPGKLCCGEYYRRNVPRFRRRRNH